MHPLALSSPYITKCKLISDVFSDLVVFRAAILWWKNVTCPLYGSFWQGCFISPCFYFQVVCIGSFSQTLRRYTSLNHLAQAARAVLQNSAQINQMLSDLNRVDFNNVQVCQYCRLCLLRLPAAVHQCFFFKIKQQIAHCACLRSPQEQASWVCQCEDRLIQRLEQDFKATLQQQNSLEQWATWLDSVVSQVLKPYEHNPMALPKAAKVFLLNWSFYRWGEMGKNGLCKDAVLC